MTIDAHVGIDVAKEKLDVTVLPAKGKRAKRFDNNRNGWDACISWLQSLKINCAHVCLEATGNYGEGIAEALHDKGQVVSVVNPAQIKSFVQTKLGRNKTDKVDSHNIAEFCKVFNPVAWVPASKNVRELRSLVRLRDAIIESRREWANRSDVGATSAVVVSSASAVIAQLDKELDRVNAAITDLIKQDPDLTDKHDLLTSIKGVGTTTAATVLVELPDVSRFRSSRQVVAYAGLNPRLWESGTSVRGRSMISKIGNSRLRSALFFPAMVAIRHNPIIRALRDRLAEKTNLRPIQIVVAAMRKLLQLCYGVLKTGRPFDPSLAATKSSA